MTMTFWSVIKKNSVSSRFTYLCLFLIALLFTVVSYVHVDNLHFYKPRNPGSLLSALTNLKTAFSIWEIWLTHGASAHPVTTSPHYLAHARNAYSLIIQRVKEHFVHLKEQWPASASTGSRSFWSSTKTDSGNFYSWFPPVSNSPGSLVCSPFCLLV